MKINLTDKKKIYDFCEPYIIAELGSNHNGDMTLARELITKAKEAGADCVKFQSWSKDTIFSKRVYKENRFLRDDYRNRTDYTLEKIVEKFSISPGELLEMRRFADAAGIDFASTPFSRKEADFLVSELNAQFIKVASMDLNNYPFLRHIAAKGLPVILSTGLGTLDEIRTAVDTIKNTGNEKIILLHCVSIYPPQDGQVNLNNIDTLRAEFGYPVGFSDHTIGYSLPLAAVAKGACVIEKHFTLDKGLFGWDHAISADPEELRIICRESKRVHAALGKAAVTREESDEMVSAFRRSIVAARPIKAGERLMEEDLDFKRPGDGIEPGGVGKVVGRVIKRDKEKDELLSWEDF